MCNSIWVATKRKLKPSAKKPGLYYLPYLKKFRPQNSPKGMHTMAIGRDHTIQTTTCTHTMWEVAVISYFERIIKEYTIIKTFHFRY